MDSKSPIVNYPTPPTTSHNLSSFSFNIKSNSGNYPFNYSPTINNCVPSNDNSNTADMSNYNNINMYNTTSIITNNTNSSFNSPNREPYNHGSNDYQASNHISNDTSNFSIASLSSYSNINYTNSSVQPLSPQELSYVDNSQVFVDGPQPNELPNFNQNCNVTSQQNYLNSNSYSNPKQMENGSPMPNNKLNNNKRLLKKNEQKLSIDTSFINPCRNDTQSSVYNCSNKDSYNIKTPTSAKSQKNSSQMNTPPKTPVKEKNKKKRGDHIHYNIKTNMFMETQQYYEVFNFGKTKSYNLKIIPKVDRGFFPTGPEKDFTCYRRNYFQISASFSAKNIKDPSLFSPCFLKVGNTFLSIQNFYIGICAKVKDSNKEIRVVQQTAKREKGPQNKPIPKVCKPGGNPSCYHGVNSNQSIVTFERLQFKSATPNTNRRSSKQQFYALVIDLYASTPFKRYKVATIESKRLIVRSRSPGHYQNSSEYDDPCLNDDSNESSVTCNDAKEDFNSPDFKNIPSTSDSSNINPTEEGCNKQQYTNPVQKNCNEQPNDPIQNNYNEHYTNSIQNNYNEHYTNPIQNNYNEHYTNPIQNNYNEHYTNPIQNNYNEHYMNNQNVNFMNSNNGQFDPANSINSTFQANNDRNSNNAFNPYTLPFNDNRNCIDNNTAANSSYLEENNAPRMNYQNSIPSNATTGSFYPINDINTPIDSPAQNGYMYQTPQLPSQQDSSLNANLTYNTTKQDFVPQYSSDNQNSYSPYVPSQVPSIFPSQAQSSQVQAYSSDNYYAQNPNQNAQIPSSPMNNPPISQNVGNASQSSYYPSNNQEFIYSNQVAPPPSYQQTPSQQQTSSSNAVSSPINGNYSVPSWTTNGVF